MRVRPSVQGSKCKRQRACVQGGRPWEPPGSKPPVKHDRGHSENSAAPSAPNGKETPTQWPLDLQEGWVFESLAGDLGNEPQ